MTQSPIDDEKFDIVLLTTDAEVARELLNAMDAAEADFDAIDLERRPITPELEP